MLEITKDQKDQLTYSSASKQAPHPRILTSKSKFLHYIILFHKNQLPFVDSFYEASDEHDRFYEFATLIYLASELAN